MKTDLEAAKNWFRRCVAIGISGDKVLGYYRAVLAHLDAEPQRIAAAKEEQREACAKVAADADCDCSEFEDFCRTKGREALHDGSAAGVIADIVRAMPLTSTPLADENAALRKANEALTEINARVGLEAIQRAEKAEAERDEAVRALREMFDDGEGCPACGKADAPGCGCRYERARSVLAKYPEGT